jgi:BirA family biotin operon repressor/biotin-[acetyl-CoA-carboxylase] ligase
MMTLRENAGSPPLRVARLTAALLRPGGVWRQVQLVAETGSTNADLLAQAAAGGAAGTVLVAEAQTAGKGRLGRSWSSAPGASLTFSVLLRPAGVPATRLGWLPLLAGVAAAAAIRTVTTVEAQLKWPNDVLASGRKLAGILAESRDQAVVVGMGVNVSQRQAGLPLATATSVLLEQAALADRARQQAQPGPGGGQAGPGREELLVAILTELARWYTAWAQPAGAGRPGEPSGDAGDPDACGLRAEYLRQCATLGRQVRVLLPGGRELTGRATDVDRLGRLVVRTVAGVAEVSAGDVVHLR